MISGLLICLLLHMTIVSVECVTLTMKPPSLHPISLCFSFSYTLSHSLSLFLSLSHIPPSHYGIFFCLDLFLLHISFFASSAANMRNESPICFPKYMDKCSRHELSTKPHSQLHSRLHYLVLLCHQYCNLYRHFAFI